MRSDLSDALSILSLELQQQALATLPLPWVLVDTARGQVLSCSTPFAKETGLKVGDDFPRSWMQPDGSTEHGRRSTRSFADLTTALTPGSTLLLGSVPGSAGEPRRRRRVSTSRSPYRVVHAHTTGSTLFLMGHWSPESRPSWTMTQRLHGRAKTLEQRARTLKDTKAQVQSMLATLTHALPMLATHAATTLKNKGLPWSDQQTQLTGRCNVIERLLDGFQQHVGSSHKSRSLSLADSMNLLRHAVGGHALQHATLQASLDPTQLVDDTLLRQILGAMACYHSMDPNAVFELLVEPTHPAPRAVLAKLRIQHSPLSSARQVELRHSLEGYDVQIVDESTSGEHRRTDLVSNVFMCRPPRGEVASRDDGVTYSKEEVQDALAGKKVLVTDDSRMVLRVLCRQLEHAGATDVVPNCDGDALVTAYDAARETTPPENIVVITDVQMPIMDGFKAIQQL